MSSLTKLPGKKDGRPYQRGWRLAIFTDKRRDFILHVKEYSKSDALALHSLATAIEEAYKSRRAFNPKKLDAYPDFKKRILNSGIFDAESDELETSLDSLCERYVDYKIRVEKRKPSTIGSIEDKLKTLRARFGDRDVREISKRDAQEFIDDMQAAGDRAEATISRRIGEFSALFKWARQRELVEFDPFEDVKRGSTANPARNEIVDLETIGKVMRACKTQEERALIALARFGGLRISEILILQWGNVDLVKGTMKVYSPKTNSTRAVPIYSPLLRELLRLRDETGGEGFVLPTTRNRSTAYARLTRAIERAGVRRWQKALQNLRVSQSNDVEDREGAKLESEFLGHSEAVARKHYRKDDLKLKAELVKAAQAASVPWEVPFD